MNIEQHSDKKRKQQTRYRVELPHISHQSYPIILHTIALSR